MRAFDTALPIVPTKNRLEGGPGVSLYLGPAGTDDPDAIEYRRPRQINHGHHVLCVGDEWEMGGTNLLHDAIVSQADCADEEVLTTLPAAYTSATFWAQIRTHESGVENPSIYRPQRITVDGSQDGSDTIDGTVIVARLVKLDGGGLRVEFDWFASVTGVQPTSWILRRTAGPTSPSDATATLRGSIEQSITIESLQDAGAYTFALIATDDTIEQTVATINYTADASGPTAPTGLSVVAK